MECNRTYNLELKTDNKGVVLILTVIVMSSLLFLGTYFLSFSLGDFKISASHASTVQGYYLAEAGLNEMIYKLKNDPSYETEFTTNANWVETFTREDALFTNSSYSVTIRNTANGLGDVTASSSIDFIVTTPTQRIAKTKIFRATGQSAIGDSGGYADGNIDISYSKVNFYGGSAHANNVFTINGNSTVNIDNDLRAVGNLNKSSSSTLNTGGTEYAKNFPPAAEYIAMPGVDFDSSDPTSLKNRADIIYSSGDFDDLMEDNQSLTLDDAITYVEGDIDIEGDQELVINGLLVAERDIIIGKKLCRGFRCGLSSITINHASSTPSGIFSKRKISFLLWAGTMDLDGIVYANDQLTVQSFPLGTSFEAHGGLVARKLTITSAWQAIDIYYDNGIVLDSINPVFSSPTINIEHWEEEY